MTTVAAYLSNLVLSQIQKKPPKPIPNNITFEQILDITSRNSMDGIILRALLQLELSEEQRNQCKGILLTKTIISMSQGMELTRISQAFEEALIKNQPMKGAILRVYYPEPEMREMGDIDILVQDCDMDHVQHILEGLQYEFVKKESHHDIYLKKSVLMVEVHRCLYDAKVDGGQSSYFGTFERSHRREGYQVTYEFSKEDFYIYMIAHMAKHFYKRGCGIRNLVDIYVYRERFHNSLDEEYMRREFEKCGLTQFVIHMEKLTNIWLGGEEGTDFYDDLFEYLMNCGIYGLDQNGIWNKFGNEKILGNKISKIQLKRWYYFPPYRYMKEYYPWLEKASFLLPVAWCLRAFGGIFAHKGIHKRELLRSVDTATIHSIQRIYKEMNLDFHM